MARSRSASRRALLAAIAAAFAASCRLFVDLDGLQGGAAPDAGDAQPPSPPGDAPADAPPADAPIDAPPFDAGADVDANTPCSSPTVIVGSDVVFGKSLDTTAQNVDAVGFTVGDAGGEARCAWIYITALVDASSPATTDVFVGVYANSASDAPSTLLAQAKIHGIIAGWNHAPLDVSLPLTAGTDIWLAYTVSTGAIEPEVSRTCGARLFEHTDDQTDGSLPATFDTTLTFMNDCDTAVYLGP